jgi:hypothetical protein
MEYRLECDDCQFARKTDDWVTASGWARDHEAAYPSHHVSLLRSE